MKINEFNTKSEANKALFEELKNDINTTQNDGKTPKILLSGGSSPKMLYQLLGSEFKQKEDLKIGLIDERFVPVDHAESNEQMIRSYFSDTLEISGMVIDDSDYQRNLDLLKEEYAAFQKDLDIAILGMGGDGHFASIFPNDDASSRAIEMEEKSLLNTNAPSDPKQRITCNMELIAGAKHIYLLIFGHKKFNLLDNSEYELPIHVMLKRRPDIKIFYAND